MVFLVKIRWIIITVKRSLVIIGTTCSMALIPAYAQAVTPSPTPLATATVPTVSTPSPLTKKAEKEAAKGAYEQSMEQAQNGRDLAFADANATKMQSLSIAGKDRDARKAAFDAYKASAIGIITVYKQAVAQARQAYKTVVDSLKGK